MPGLKPGPISEAKTKTTATAKAETTAKDRSRFSKGTTERKTGFHRK
jgi:hypothetical protein